MKALLTGGTGYIGSHTAVAMVLAGHDVVLFDNLSNSSVEAVRCIETVLARGDRASPVGRVHFVQGDTRDYAALSAVLREFDVEAVLHFAGLKAVGESVQEPLAYFDNNVAGTICLLRAMKGTRVKTLIFSSSATVYGDPLFLPLDETHPTCATSPYGRTKLHIEEMLKDVSIAEPDWRIACLRYFNPVGAHASGLIGENPNGIPNNLVPFIARVAMGRLPCLEVFGDDYETPDGTGVRDYIHVMDLAEGHLAMLDHLNRGGDVHAGANQVLTLNLGTGRSSSVLEMMRAFEAASGRSVPYRIVSRRPGDVAVCYADPGTANRLLGWTARRSVAEMCESTWRHLQLAAQSDPT